jgi:superfamily II DNA helicase RecQ
MLQSDECAIDFIDDVGPIMSELSNHGIDSVAYYREMDIRSRMKVFTGGGMEMLTLRWLLASAFGMGIN